MMKKNLWENINYIKQNDEIKFVIGNKEDYDWAKDMIDKYNLHKICPILFSPVYNQIDIKVPIAIGRERDHIPIR